MRKLPNWISTVLKVAGILHFFLAAGLVFFSNPILAIIQSSHSGLNSTLWLDVSAIGFATLGLGYLVASFNTLRNSVALFMGLSANCLGLILLPAYFGLATFTNGFLAAGLFFMLVWAAILLLMLYKISKVRHVPQSLAHNLNEPFSKTLSRFRTQKGKSLLQLSNEKPALVIFLHHFGSALSRKALLDIKQKQATIEGEGASLVFVHLVNEEKAQAFFQKTGLEHEHRISDPNGIMYNAFGLDRTSFARLPKWHSWLREVRAIFSAYGIGLPLEDGFQMPGVFLISQGEIIKSYRHDHASGGPDYVSLANGEAA